MTQNPNFMHIFRQKKKLQICYPNFTSMHQCIQVDGGKIPFQVKYVPLKPIKMQYPSIRRYLLRGDVSFQEGVYIPHIYLLPDGNGETSMFHRKIWFIIQFPTNLLLMDGHQVPGKYHFFTSISSSTNLPAAMQRPAPGPILRPGSPRMKWFMVVPRGLGKTRFGVFWDVLWGGHFPFRHWLNNV